MKKLLVLLIILLIMVGCKDSDDDDNDKSSDRGYHTYDYTLLTNSSYLPEGGQVIIVYAKCENDSCSSQSNFTQVHKTTAESPGNAKIAYSAPYKGKYWYTIYMDTDKSGVLSSGDYVWTNTGLSGIMGAVKDYPNESHHYTQSLTWHSRFTIGIYNDNPKTW